MRFFKKIQDRILKSGRIRKWILRFFTKQINPRSFGSCCVKGTEESTSRVDSSVPLTHRDPRNLGLICLVKKRKIRFQILSYLRIQSWIFLQKRTLIASVASSTKFLVYCGAISKKTGRRNEGSFNWLPVMSKQSCNKIKIAMSYWLKGYTVGI